eukprot:3534500-Rhodomonas_salina.2
MSFSFKFALCPALAAWRKQRSQALCRSVQWRRLAASGSQFAPRRSRGGSTCSACQMLHAVPHPPAPPP